jgi:hypothetical protein
MSKILELLSEYNHKVVLVPGDGMYSQPAASDLHLHDIEVAALHPQSVQFGSFLRAIKERVKFVIMSRPDTAISAFGPVVQNLPLVPLIYDMVDAHGLRKRTEALVTGSQADLQEALRVESIERRMAQVADVVVTLSEADEEEIQRLAGRELRTLRVSNIHRSGDTGPGFEARQGLLFVGGYEHSPNVDAVVYFVNEVLPLVQREIGPVRVTLAGSKPTTEVLELAAGNVIVPGWIEDLAPLYHEARVAIAPLRFGAGVKGKIGEAMSFGVPVVSSSVGVSGMYLDNGQNVLVGDTPQEFAEAIVRLYRDATLWNHIRLRAITTLEQRFGWEQSKRQVETLIDQADLVQRERLTSVVRNKLP